MVTFDLTWNLTHPMTMVWFSYASKSILTFFIWTIFVCGSICVSFECFLLSLQHEEGTVITLLSIKMNVDFKFSG